MSGHELRELVAGNDRYTAGRPEHGHFVSRARMTAATQHPYAMVIGCIDSRVPPEAIFDQDFGAITVVRTAGHVLDRSVIGSIEFAVDELSVPLVLVLGHSRCGAVGAAMAAQRTGVRPEGDGGYLIDQIAPAVWEVGLDGPDAYERAVRRHVARTVDRLAGAGGLAVARAQGRVRIVGAVYDLDSGAVTVLPDGADPGAVAS